ncbi:MAG: hypothetical protein BIP78_0787 [Candidatus Bipolaricaulis sibiricus]|uniref:Uncharacterized protein n=1 Tax=Bipolaricaulis sibiricus TaxID=2501609 RepID=A0A410FU55_BIPS1|nr:MAG: hypothetical protein BIP78_0787 [Candidatus Bipolaricaulis sibiricus]
MFARATGPSTADTPDAKNTVCIEPLLAAPTHRLLPRPRRR